MDPKSSKTTGHHIFVEPKGSLASELQAVINDLARTHGSPVFAPHVTVLARISNVDEKNLIQKTAELAASLQPCTLTLGKLMNEPAFYRALYSRIEEQDVLQEYHERASAIFGLEKNPNYVAHLSLLYGNYAPEAAAEIKRSLVYPEGATFEADTLHLYRTEGEVGQWQKIREFPIG